MSGWKITISVSLALVVLAAGQLAVWGTGGRGAPVEAIIAALERDGGAIVLDFLTPEAVAGLTASGWSVVP